MSGDFIVERAALHLVDRKRLAPDLSQHPINLTGYQSQEDAAAIRNFFEGHLRQVWETEESRRTRAAKFTEQAVMRRFYDEIVRDGSAFFTRSCDMAQQLYEVSSGRRTSPGILMVLWFRKAGDERPFLALLKMDPGRSDKISLGQDSAGAVLLDLAVHHIEQALPDSTDRVLKWAVMPHPTRRTFDIKVKDEQGSADTAQYFMTFLGCTVRPSEKELARALLEVLPEYASSSGAGEDWKQGVNMVVTELEKEPVITPDVVVATIQKTKALPNFQEADFRKKLAESKASDINIPSEVLRATRIEYRLPSGITIRGATSQVESLVEIVPMKDGGVEFRIKTPSYEKKYV